MNSHLTHSCYISRKTRRDLEVLAKLRNPEATSELADSVAEGILRAHLDGVPELNEIHKKTGDFFNALKKEHPQTA